MGRRRGGRRGDRDPAGGGLCILERTLAFIGNEMQLGDSAKRNPTCSEVHRLPLAVCGEQTAGQGWNRRLAKRWL